MLELKKYWKTYTVCVLLGILCFLVVFGAAPLDPQNDGWLLGENADLTQHYIGWLGYRYSDWQFPIGCTDNLAYPFQTSVIFTDSIPLLAVLCKVFSPILPETFQYFGLYGLLCFILQPLTAAVLLKKYVPTQTGVIFGSILVTLSPVMLLRMYYHTALSSHFLLFMAMLALVYYEEVFCRTGYALLLSVLTAFLASSIHIYLLALCGVIWLGYCLLDIMKTHRLRRGLLTVGAYILTAACVVWLLGGFNRVLSIGRGGLGSYGMNLNAFFNSQGNAALLPGLTLPEGDKKEGFAYLGLGVLFLMTAQLFTACLYRKRLWERLKGSWQKAVSFAFIGIVTYLLAIMPCVYWNDTLLVEIRRNDLVEKLWSVFRVTGRFVWPAYYLCILGAVIFPYWMKLERERILTAILGVALLIQVYDISPQAIQKKYEFSQWIENEAALQDPIWEEIAQSGRIEHVYFCFSDMDYDAIYPVTRWAVTNDMTVNRFYFARTLDARATEVLGDAMWEKEPECLFVFRTEDLPIGENAGFKVYMETEDDLLLAGKIIEREKTAGTGNFIEK